MKQRWLGVAAVGVVCVIGASPASAALLLATITVASGPTSSTSFAAECNDVLETVDVAESFVIKRDTAGPPQDVSYTTSGSAIAGTDYEPLSGSATIPDGADQVAVPVQVLNNSDLTRAVTLTMTITPSANYTSGDPASVTIEFVSHRDPSLPEKDCNPGFMLTDAPSNTEQTIGVGDTPAALQTTFGSSFTVQVEDGSLPPGVGLDPGDLPPDAGLGSGGGFIGAATTVGSYTATLRLCPGGNVAFTCRTTTLTVHVVPRAEALARTGPVPRAEALARTGPEIAYELVGALVLFGIGAVFCRAARVEH